MSVSIIFDIHNHDANEHVEKTPFHVRCEDCKHAWIGAYVPMPLYKFASVVGALHCPQCGADAERIFSDVKQ